MPKKGNIPWNKNKKGMQIAWNKDLTKETDDRIIKLTGRPSGIPQSEEWKKRMSILKTGKKRPNMFGKKSWNNGLTKQTDFRLQKMTGRPRGSKTSLIGKQHLSDGMKKYLALPEWKEQRRNAILKRFENGWVVKNKHGFRADLNSNCRSSWEANYLRILKLLNIDFLYEPHPFVLTDGEHNMTYLPDIYIPKYKVMIEIKGYAHAWNVYKLELFKQQYPQYKLVVIDKLVYRRLCDKYKRSIDSWE